MMKWLLIGVLLLAQYPLLPLRVTGPGATPPPPTDHPLLTEDNLTYIGGFNFPTTVNNGSSNVSTAGAGGAFAVRIVAGQPQFYSTLNDGSDNIYEVDYPGAISTNFALWLTGTGHYISNAYQSKRCTSITVSGGFDCTGSSTYGLFWDETDQRLYWTYGWAYANDADSAAVGYSTLSGLVATAAGAWKMASPVDGKAVRGGMLAIPAWFQTAHATSMTGKRLGSGFGGYYSLGQRASEGATLVAWDPAQTATVAPATHVAAGGHMVNEPLALFGGSGATPFTSPPLGQRDALYESSAWRPNWWQQGDMIFGGAWVDIAAAGVGHPGVSGMITFSSMNHGGTGYFQAQLQGDHLAVIASITDPAVLGSVADGNALPESANPTTRFYPSIRVGRGAAFDSTTNRLYVFDPTTTPPAVYVYQVADTVTAAAPVFVGNPGNVSISSGSTNNTAIFRVNVEGKPRPTIQWQTSPTGTVWTDFTGNADGINKPTADGSILYFTPTSLSQNGLKIRAIATNASGSTTSSTGTLTITGSAVYAAAAFSVDPASHSIQANHTGALSATTTGSPAPVNYLWWYSLDSGVTWVDWNQAGAGDGTHTNTLTFQVNQLPLSYDQSQWRVCVYQPGFWVRNTIHSLAGSVGSKCSGIATLTITP